MWRNYANEYNQQRMIINWTQGKDQGLFSNSALVNGGEGSFLIMYRGGGACMLLIKKLLFSFRSSIDATDKLDVFSIYPTISIYTRYYASAPPNLSMLFLWCAQTMSLPHQNLTGDTFSPLRRWYLSVAANKCGFQGFSTCKSNLITTYPLSPHPDAYID